MIKIKKLFVLTAIGILSLIIPFFMVGCDEKHNHNYGEWETTAVATCHSLEQQKRFCKDCNDKETRNVGTYKNHNYGEWETYTQADCNNSEEERRF